MHPKRLDVACEIVSNICVRSISHNVGTSCKLGLERFGPEKRSRRGAACIGAGINHRSHTGQTPLHDAAHAGDSIEVSLCVLLRSGATVDARTDLGMSPLHEATLYTRSIKYTVRRLLNAGAEIDSLDNSGHSPLDLALRRGRWTFPPRAITDRARCTISAAVKLSLLQDAATSCNAQLVKVLLDHGFRSLVNTTDGNGRTSLHLAIIARWRTEHIIDYDDWSLTSTERLNHGMEKQVSVARLLLSNGADIEALDAHGATALHYAVGFGGEQVASVLLEYGADVAVKAGDGNTALQMAKAIGNDASVRLSIQYEARDEVHFQDQPLERPARRTFRFLVGIQPYIINC